MNKVNILKGSFLALMCFGMCTLMIVTSFQAYTWNSMGRNISISGLRADNPGGRNISISGLRADNPGGRNISISGLRADNPGGRNNSISGLRADNRGYQRVTSDGTIYAYSAYYDSRTPIMLRVFIICTQVYMDVSYTCHIQMKTGEIRNVSGGISPLWDWRVPTYMSGVVKCPLKSCCGSPDNMHSVSIHPHKITSVRNVTILEHELAIIMPAQQRTHTLVRCYPPIHSNYSRFNKVIWNIEISKLSGADKFIFYNESISPNVDIVLRHYINEGVVEMRPWDIPVKDRPTIHYWGQMLAIHDCLVSQMFKAKYVLLADLDEIFITNKGLSVVQLADEVFKYNNTVIKSKLGAIIFGLFAFDANSTMVSRHRIKNIQEAKRLAIDPLLQTTYFVPPVSTKTLVIPERTETMWVHYPISLKPGIQQITLPKTKGIMLHYRDTPDYKESKPVFRVCEDLLKYSNDIISVISNRTKLIFPENQPLP